ncbi:MAG: cryptochrome/photolyase family protein [Bacteroidota bacterium]|nr:cryptochrome/photolyase family protein [Bacteroidota bacterium]MDX5431610.1 cryptochrome/photolyase family protein [Bacteroidota bacterium]MDX5470331.1 cryptochrome/photolyase family protein [Bacteroidota bacterium]
MKEVLVLLPHQLDQNHPMLSPKLPVILVEEFLFFRHYHFHKIKLAYHRATMKHFEMQLRAKNIAVSYISSFEKESDIRELLPSLTHQAYQQIHFIEPSDDWLERRIHKVSKTCSLSIQFHPSNLFLNSKEELEKFFKPEKKSFFQTSFYKQERQKRNILVENGNPAGGQWTFDVDNRKKYPSDKTPPSISLPAGNPLWKEAIDYVEKYFPENPGTLTENWHYPITEIETRAWLKEFLNFRFAEFGPYEDAILRQENFLHHSVLTPMLNIGLLDPNVLLEVTLRHAEKHAIPIASLEGFVRQIIGWREFMRGMYQCKGRYMRSRNFWVNKRKIPPRFYTGTTGIAPIDDVIKKVLKTGYCHHIERLMVLGNFMLLCEFDPDEVYRWFMELFIDAYDWVMVPNVYGMSQFADGGTFATKPYISGSNYLFKMSDYSKKEAKEWAGIWDALFWSFMAKNRSFFESNPRLSLLVKQLDTMGEDKLVAHQKIATAFKQKLDQETKAS